MKVTDKISKYLKEEEKEEINEAGFFKDLYGVIKTGKQLTKMGESLPKMPKGDREAFIKELKSRIEKGLDIIEKANISKEIKTSMRKGFLAGVMGKLIKESPSLLDVKNLFHWNQTLHGEMYRAWDEIGDK